MCCGYEVTLVRLLVVEQLCFSFGNIVDSSCFFSLKAFGRSCFWFVSWAVMCPSDVSPLTLGVFSANAGVLEGLNSSKPNKRQLVAISDFFRLSLEPSVESLFHFDERGVEFPDGIGQWEAFLLSSFAS